MNKNLIVIAGIISSIFLTACGGNQAAEQKESKVEEKQLTEAESMIQEIEIAHNKTKYEAKEVIQFDLNLIFGGKTRFNGRLSMTPNGGLVRLEDSTKTMIWDGENAYLFPDTIAYEKTRFDVLTWSYFFAAPYKLNDPGAKHEYLASKMLNDQAFSALKLSFESGVGDSPDDWYVVYQDQESKLLAALAYIVTYGKSKEAAESDPHAITYEAYTEVDGIPFATQWNFWTWNEKGELNKLLGEAQISNIQFIKKAEGMFQPPAQSRKVEKPAA